jgi:hypothetical protein
MDHIQIITRVAVGLAQHNGFCCCPEQNRSVLAPRLASAMEELLKLKGMLAYNFLSFFFISFQEIQKLDGPKSEKPEVPFHELLSFSLLEPSDFWISRKLIHISDEKLKQTPPKSV